MEKLDALQKITRAKIQLYKRNPFFSYLVFKLQVKELTEQQRAYCKANGMIPTACVDNYGYLYYDDDFINSLDEEAVSGLLIHETLHLVFEHLSRLQKRDNYLFNTSTDLVINNLLVNNGFQLPKPKLSQLQKINPKLKESDIINLIPKDNEFELPIGNGKKIIIKDLDKKSAERVYDEIYKKLPKETQDAIKNGRFDIHIYMDKNGGGNGNKQDKEGNELTISVSEKELKELSKKWKEELVKASIEARQRGNLPLGMERYIDELINEKVNWRAILLKYLTNSLPYNYSYSAPSKRSQAIGVYMPRIVKENLEVVVSVDTSGSIQQKELSEFMSEIVGISRAFSNIKITILVCDCAIQDVLVCENGNIDTILNLKIKGGGGTSHIPVYNYIKENMPMAKILINLSDGYTEFPKEESVRTIWAICKGGVEDDKIPFGTIIRLED